MTRQERILRETAEQHGLTYLQAYEIWNLLSAKLAEVLNTKDLHTDGLFDATKFKSIHIDHFGKFIPHTKAIAATNNLLKQKQQ
jgi:hypothetical protein